MIRRVDLGRLDYGQATQLQEGLVDRRAAGEVGDLLLLLEHDHVFTLGRRGQRENLLDPLDEHGEPIPVFEVARGGDITYHGPGQLVGYPIVKLGDHGGDVVRYLRALEEALIVAVGRFGVSAERNPPYTGIWSGGEKIASIGISVRRDVTWHGFALNVSTDLSYFDRIVPCGLRWARMTSLERLLGRGLWIGEVRDAVAEGIAAALGVAVERGEL
ncbi:MAG: octanoyltransferase [Myxococcales bacterium]